jgi:hypothetical protein
VPSRKLFGSPGTGNGSGGSTYGLPRFANATFKTRFPFGVVTLGDPQLPLSVEITGWSPFERSLRETEFGPSQNEAGHQQFRSGLPIRPVEHDFHAAADGQLGGIMKVFREWRISGDTEWLRGLWPKVKRSLDY